MTDIKTIAHKIMAGVSPTDPSPQPQSVSPSKTGPTKKNEKWASPEYPYPFSAKRVAYYQAELAGRPLPAICPACGGTGYLKKGDVPVGHPDFGQIERCSACNLDRRAAWLAQHCGLNPVEQGLRLTEWRANGGSQDQANAPRYRALRKQAGQALQTALRERAGLYTFFGDFGAGKTLALQIIANEARLQMIESFYAPFSLLLDHLRALYEGNQPTSSFWQRLLDIPVLCVDEVTRFNETSWAKERLFTLADTRHRRRASHLTLFATNHDPTVELPTPAEDIGYLFSRMRQGRLIELRGDLRQALKDEPEPVGWVERSETQQP